MAGAAIGVDDEGVGAVENARVRRPAIREDEGGNVRDVGEAAGKKEAAGAVFVLAGAVAGGAGDEDDAPSRRGSDGERGQQEKELERACHDGVGRRVWRKNLSPSTAIS